MKFRLFSMFALLSASLQAQTDSSKKLTVFGYADIYYSYDFSNPGNHEKENFLFNHKRHNEINANLILVRTEYVDKTYRAKLGLMAGNYAQYNLSSEPIWAQFIYESSVGVKLSNRHNLWLDAGIMPSHIGFESAISADCWTLTRSMLAENSPYYESGLKLSYANKKNNLAISFLVLNGWQRIKKLNDSQYPSFGLQVNYQPKDNIILNYSNFIGTDKPDSVKALRTYHNFYLQYMYHQKLGIILGFDFGTDKLNKNDYAYWFSPVVILKYAVNSKVNIAMRGEYYNDRHQLIISTNTPNGFQTFGWSTNLDYQLNHRMKVRLEGKVFKSKDAIFSNGDSMNYSLTSNMSITL